MKPMPPASSTHRAAALMCSVRRLTPRTLLEGADDRFPMVPHARECLGVAIHHALGLADQRVRLREEHDRRLEQRGRARVLRRLVVLREIGAAGQAAKHVFYTLLEDR